MLHISRPSLIQLLDEGKIEFRRIGTHRRVRFEALMEYKRQADAERRLEVTDRGRTVVLLSPLPEGATPLERLKAQRRVSPAAGDLLDLGLGRNRSVTTRLSPSLGEIRDDRF